MYPLRSRPVRGIGRVGRLPQPTKLATLARKLKRTTRATGVQVVGDPDHTIDRAVILVGAAGSIPFRGRRLASGDVIITGEIRHHDALTILRNGCTAVALGHWASERPVLESLAGRVRQAVPGITVRVSTEDRDPFRAI